MSGSTLPPASHPESGLVRGATMVGDVVVGGPERRIFSIFGYCLPDSSVLRQVKFQHLLSAKFLADAARDSVKYAAIVSVVYSGGGAFASSLIGVASLIPGVAFSLYGGTIADSIPKRAALAIAYGTDIVLLIVFATVFGESTLAAFSLVFLVSTLTQLASPAEQTLIPLVTSEAQLAAANSTMGMVSSIGTAFGTAFLAPILLKAFGSDAVYLISAGLLLAAMTRVVHLEAPGDVARAAIKRPQGQLMRALRWLSKNPSVGTMVAVSAVAGMGYTIMSTLAPTYVNEVLDQDPANTVYIMGVAGVGMTISLFLIPALISRFGERAVAAGGFASLMLGLVGLGLVESGALNFLTPVNPVHWFDELVGFLDLNQATETAMLLAFPLGAGAGLTDNSVRVYINRRVPLGYQGRTFATRGLTESALTIPPLIGISALAVWVGISAALFIMPVVFYVVAVALIRASYTLSGEHEVVEHPRIQDVYWQASDEAEISPLGEGEEEAPRNAKVSAPVEK